MRPQPKTSHRRTALAACLATLAALAAGCSSTAASRAGTSPTSRPTSSVSHAPHPKTDPPSVTSSKPSQSPPTTANSIDLSGSWSGQYSGHYSGTFKLSWQQRGSRLSGQITLSEPASTQSLTGTLNGDHITFGTVGSSAISYSGTVSGNSMSGAFQVGGSPGGSWNATKSS